MGLWITNPEHVDKVVGWYDNSIHESEVVNWLFSVNYDPPPDQNDYYWYEEQYDPNEPPYPFNLYYETYKEPLWSGHFLTKLPKR